MNEEKAFESVICIPGNWSSRSDFLHSLISSGNSEYLFAGNILLHPGSGRHYTVEFCDRDERMKDAFRYAGMVTRITDPFIDEIDTHTHVIYLSGPTGNLEAAMQIAFAATAILNSGGIGIKIETAGKAFEKNKWLSYITAFELPNLYRMFVIDSIMDTDGNTYSCGMHNLGLKDTIVAGEEFQSAVSLISLFAYYQIIDQPTIQNNQTFSADKEAPVFSITHESDQPNQGDELFENPFGMWRLSRK